MWIKGGKITWIDPQTKATYQDTIETPNVSKIEASRATAETALSVATQTLRLKDASGKIVSTER